MSRFRPFVLMVFVVALAVTVAPVWAQQGRGQGNGHGQPAMRDDDRGFPRPPMAAPVRERTMSESVRWAQKTTGGQVLGAERVQSDGRDFNRVKLIDDRGRVRYMDDVPQSRRQASPPPASSDSTPRPPRL